MTISKIFLNPKMLILHCNNGALLITNRLSITHARKNNNDQKDEKHPKSRITLLRTQKKIYVRSHTSHKTDKKSKGLKSLCFTAVVPQILINFPIFNTLPGTNHNLFAQNLKSFNKTYLIYYNHLKKSMLIKKTIVLKRCI